MNGATVTTRTRMENHAFKAWIEILRPVNCILGALTIIIGMLNHQDTPVASAVFSSANGIILVMLGCGIYFITAGASNTINDYFDIEIDKINRPERPIPRGAISKAGALRYYLVLSASSLVLSAIVGYWTPNPLFIPLFNGLFLFVGFFYALKGKPSGFPGNIIVGISFSFGMPFGALFMIDILAIPSKVWFFFVTSSLLLISRELVKGMEDMEGDRQFRIKTVANTKGLKVASSMSIIFSILAIVSFTIPAFTLINRIPFMVFMVIGNCAVVGSIAFLLKGYETKGNQSRSSLMLKLGAFSGLIAYVLAGF